MRGIAAGALRPIDTGAELPGGLADALHLLQPWWQSPERWLPAVLALLLLWWWWRRRGARRTAPAPRPAAPPPPLPAPPGPSSLAVAIRELRDRYRASGDLREGLHRLSVLLREHLVPLLPWDERHPGHTALELAHRFDDGPSGPVLRVLSDLQFAGREPTRESYDDAFRVAEVVARDLASRRRQGWSWAPPVDPRTGRPPVDPRMGRPPDVVAGPPDDSAERPGVSAEPPDLSGGIRGVSGKAPDSPDGSQPPRSRSGRARRSRR